MFIRALIAAVAASALLGLIPTRGGPLEAQTTEPDSSTATASATATGLAPETTPIPETAIPETVTPLPESEKSMSLVGYVIEDADGDGVRSAGDRPAETLAQMLVVSGGYVDRGAVLRTDSEGRFQFDDLSPADYEFALWWSPGFLTLQQTPVLDAVLYGRSEQYGGLLKLRVAVADDGRKTYSYATSDYVDGRFRLRDVESAPAIPSGDLVILVRRKPEGLIPYPVATGAEAGVIPVGRVSLRQVSMPSSGSGGDPGGVSMGWWLVGVGAVLLTGTTVFLYVERRFKTRRA
jgi:hypothetical protein